MVAEKREAIALLSGGLDSLLAIGVITSQGIGVEALHFYTGFSVEERRRRLGHQTQAYGHTVLRRGAQMGATVRVVDVSQQYLEVALHPRHGYGRNVNPCLDCHLFMLRQARERMVREGADFVITGEVLGQRPMSQHGRALQLLERESDLEGLLLRPLSAKLLTPTIPEERGWVDRTKLHSFQGRSRKPQMQLAKELGLIEYPQPAGGCLLTDENYARRFRDAVAFAGPTPLTPDDMMLLAIGRHFRVSERAKCVVGRDESDNRYLDRARGTKGRMVVQGHMGPVTLVEGSPSPDDQRVVARIAARYSDGRDEPLVTVLSEINGMQETLQVRPMPLEKVHALMI